MGLSEYFDSLTISYRKMGPTMIHQIIIYSPCLPQKEYLFITVVCYDLILWITIYSNYFAARKRGEN